MTAAPRGGIIARTMIPILRRPFATSWPAAVLLALSGCASPPEPAPIELPLVGTVGDLPPAAATFAVEVSRHGTIRVDGRERSFDEYCELLRRRAGTMPAPRVGWIHPTSDLNLLLSVHRELPFAALWRILAGSIAERQLRVGRHFFEVRSEQDGDVGALALFLMYETDDNAVDPGAVPAWVVELRRGDARSAPSALHGPLQDAMAAVGPWLRDVGHVAVVADEDVCWGVVLETVDIAIRSGAEKVFLAPTGSNEERATWRGYHQPDRPRDLEALVASIPGDDRPIEIHFGGRVLSPTPTPLSAVPRLRGAYAGQAEFRGYQIREIEGEDEAGFVPWVDRGR